MSTYFLKIAFNDEPAEQDVDLQLLDHEQAEAYAADVRAQVEHARSIDAPVIVVEHPQLADLTIDPRHVASIDLHDGPLTGATRSEPTA